MFQPIGSALKTLGTAYETPYATSDDLPLEVPDSWTQFSDLARRTPPAVPKPRFSVRANVGPGPNPLDIQDPRNLCVVGSSRALVEGIVRRASKPMSAELVATVERYAYLVLDTLQIDQTHVLMARRYLERLPANVLSGLGSIKLVAGCLMLAMKYGNDQQVAPREWSRVTGIRVVDLMGIERSILKGLQWDVSVGDVGPAPRQWPFR